MFYWTGWSCGGNGVWKNWRDLLAEKITCFRKMNKFNKL